MVDRWMCSRRLATERRLRFACRCQATIRHTHDATATCRERGMMRLRLMVVGSLPGDDRLPAQGASGACPSAARSDCRRWGSRAKDSGPASVRDSTLSACGDRAGCSRRARKESSPDEARPARCAAAGRGRSGSATGAYSGDWRLSAGGASAESRKAVYDLIVANDKRIAGLSAGVKEKQKDQIARVRNFQADAQKALEGGDSEGAMTLATKAKVLLDEISR